MPVVEIVEEIDGHGQHSNGKVLVPFVELALDGLSGFIRRPVKVWLLRWLRQGEFRANRREDFESGPDGSIAALLQVNDRRAADTGA
nr:hypothetical protein [Arthrobacter sp. VKM Ac-2550]